MLISVIMPVYNRVGAVHRAIDSVMQLVLPPDDMECELIIVDDGSTDKTRDIIRCSEKIYKKGAIKVYSYKQNRGVNYARNYGIRKARGDYILFHDSDDELCRDTLIKISKALTDHPGYMVYMFQTIRNGKVMQQSGSYYERSGLRERLSGSISGEFLNLVDRKVFDEIMFDEDRFAFEQIFWNRVSKKFCSDILIPEKCRIYHDDVKNRLCKQLVDPKYASIRTADYEAYLQEFNKDYRTFGLEKQLYSIYFKTGFYSMLAKDVFNARLYFEASRCINSRIAYFLSYFGRWPFLIIAKIVQWRA